MGMQCFQPGKSAQPKPRKIQSKTPTLADAPGVKVGLSIEWSHGNRSDELTPQEVAAIMRETGCKTVKTFRAVAIKNLMLTKTPAEIVRHFKGKKGYKERTIRGICSALSKCGGGVK